MISSKSIVLTILLVCTAWLVTAADLGQIKIPVDATYGGRAVAAGLYSLEIDETSKEPYLRLIKNQKLIATDLAIVLPARGPGETSVQLTKVAKKEFVRIRARHGDHWYFAYLKKAR